MKINRYVIYFNGRRTLYGKTTCLDDNSIKIQIGKNNYITVNNNAPEIFSMTIRKERLMDMGFVELDINSHPEFQIYDSAFEKKVKDCSIVVAMQNGCFIYLYPCPIGSLTYGELQVDVIDELQYHVNRCQSISIESKNFEETLFKINESQL